MNGKVEYEFHEYANLFPMLEGEELDKLAQSIKEQGLLDSIRLYEGKVLDGRNRYVACAMAGVEPRFVEYEGDNPLGFVVAANLIRRHLTASQRAMLAADLEPMYAAEAAKRIGQKGVKDGESLDKNTTALPRARDQAGAAVGVSGTYVQLAKEVKAKSPELAQQVRDGTVHIEAANAKVRTAEGRTGRKTQRVNARAEVQEVKLYTEAMRAYKTALEEAIDAKERGKFAPESVRFVGHKHGTIRKLMETLEDQGEHEE